MYYRLHGFFAIYVSLYYPSRFAVTSDTNLLDWRVNTFVSLDVQPIPPLGGSRCHQVDIRRLPWSLSGWGALSWNILDRPTARSSGVDTGGWGSPWTSVGKDAMSWYVPHWSTDHWEEVEEEKAWDDRGGHGGGVCCLQWKVSVDWWCREGLERDIPRKAIKAIISSERSVKDWYAGNPVY